MPILHAALADLLSSRTQVHKGETGFIQVEYCKTSTERDEGLLDVLRYRVMEVVMATPDKYLIQYCMRRLTLFKIFKCFGSLGLSCHRRDSDHVIMCVVLWDISTNCLIVRMLPAKIRWMLHLF
jgi:hypothetical protein